MTTLARIALWLATLVLAACGPTTGGSGTGDTITLADFSGVTAASTCGSVIAPSLQCDVAVSDLPGTATVQFAGSAGSGDYTLQLQGNRAELKSRCGRWQFNGDWALLATGESRFLGGAAATPGGALQRAQLAVQTLPAGGLQLVLLDMDGRTLLGPLAMQRVDALPVTAPLCP